MSALNWLRKQVRTSWCEAFDHFDRNGDGRISVRELRETLDALGDPVSEERALALLESADLDQDGGLDVDEFAHLLAGHELPPHVRDELALGFRVFDRDGDGCVDPRELAEVLDSFGGSFDEAEIAALFGACDTDGNGCIAFDEFRRVLLGH